jgi:hypothetical protein
LQRAIGAEAEFDNPLAFVLRSRRIGGARFGHVGKTVLRSREAAAVPKLGLDKGDVHRSMRRIPVVERAYEHVGTDAGPAEVLAGGGSGQPVGIRSVFDEVVLTHSPLPCAPKRIAQAVGPDIIACGNTVAFIVERIIGWRAAVQFEAQYLAAERVQIQRSQSFETVTHMHIEFSIGAERQIRDAVRPPSVLCNRITRG